jgi:hypothetical protein
MVHPVKTPLNVARVVTHLTLDAVRHPLQTAGGVVTMGRGVVTAVVTGHRADTTSSVVESAGPVAQPAPGGEEETVKKQGDPLTKGTRAREDTLEPAAGPDESAAEPAASPADVPAHEQIVTEPSAVTGPGDAEEIPSPAVQPEDEDEEVVTPVGTTGAGPAVNPDTTESDLQQPGTEPLMDPATTKRIKQETETLRKASDWQKG